jgi:Tol biopolymer transport system component
MKQKCTNEHVRRRVGDSAFKLAGICCVLVLALAPTKMLATEPENLPPAGTQLAFVRDDQIYLINADGSGLIQLTDAEPGVANMDPAWSRDGQRLAFVRYTLVGEVLGGGDIYIMDADGSNVVWLTSGSEPVWGPGDRTILFGGGGGLAVIGLDADGSRGTTILLDRPGYNAQPAWSPDGQTITFSSDYRAYDTLYDLYAMNSDGTDVRPVLEGPFFWADGLVFYFQSAWSPDGQSIAVVSCTWEWDNCYPDSAITVANSDGSGLREIAQAGGLARPTWSPDGRWIAYASSACPSCETSIRYVQVDGGNEGLLMDDGHSPAWRPDPGALNAPDDPEGPIKEPDEPKDPDEPNKPAPIKLPECGSKCDKEGKLTGSDSHGHQ